MSYKSVAVIGASGLLGKPLTAQLSKAGFEVTVISRDTSKLKSTFNHLNNIKYVDAEASDAEKLKEAFTGLA